MVDYALMNQLLYEGKAKEVEELTRQALDEGRPVQEVLTDGLIAGMSVVGYVAANTTVAFLWHNLIGAVVVFVTGMIVSELTGARRTRVGTNL